MKIIRMRHSILAILLAIVASTFLTRPAYGASAEVKLSSDAMEVTLGDEFFVYVTVTSSTQFGDFEANITYDSDILEYQSGASQVKGSDGFLRINDQGVTKGATQRKYTMKFEATAVGICEFSFSGNVMVYDYESGAAMSVSSDTLTINVKAPVTASSNAKLKSLQITTGQLTPEFNPDTLEYSTQVPYDTTQLVIVALAEDDKSTVKISGNDSLKEGENKISITVLAESGANIEYIINVNRDAAPVEVTPEPEAEPKSSFEVLQLEDGTYAVYSGRYKLLEASPELEIPEGYIKTKLNISNISITAFSPKDNISSEFLLLYAENEAGETGFYRYDRVEKTLQRYKPEKVAVPMNTVQLPQESMTKAEYESGIMKAGIVIAILTALSALLLILIIRMYMKLRGYRDDELD